jgi:hypothetical protein
MLYPMTKPFDDSKLNPNWYRENEYYEYHRIKGHSLNKCHGLNNCVHDHNDRGEIIVEGNHSSNS